MSQIAAQRFGEWFWGSIVLAVAIGLVGGAATYLAARFIHWFRGPFGNG